MRYPTYATLEFSVMFLRLVVIANIVARYLILRIQGDAKQKSKNLKLRRNILCTKSKQSIVITVDFINLRENEKHIQTYVCTYTPCKMEYKYYYINLHYINLFVRFVHIFHISHKCLYICRFTLIAHLLSIY